MTPDQEEIARLTARVDELLAANNREVERRRRAERMLDIQMDYGRTLASLIGRPRSGTREGRPSSLLVKAEAHGAQSIDDVLADAVILACAIDCTVMVEVNQVQVLAFPGDDPAALRRGYDRTASAHGKVAFADPRRAPAQP